MNNCIRQFRKADSTFHKQNYRCTTDISWNYRCTTDISW